MTVAVFSYDTWATRYPEVASYTDRDKATLLFDEVGQYLANTDSSLVPADPGTYQPRLGLLNMLVAHVAYLEKPDREGVVGRVSQAAQGSVSASFEMAPASASSAWYQQSPYGANYWRATARYRMGGRFFMPRRRC